MSDYGSDYGSDGEWLYVEDHYDMADELAEHICPSPVYFGHDNPHDDYDPYDYFEDISYLSDSYNDEEANANKKTATRTNGSATKKRKREEVKVTKQPNKRLKTHKGVVRSENESGKESTVVWKTGAERDDEYFESVSLGSVSLGSFALLPGWKALEEAPKVNAAFMLGAIPSPLTPEPEESQVDPNTDIEDEPKPAAVGVDVADLCSIAGLLSGEGMEALQDLLKSKGLDPEAVQLVLQDMISGHERAFESEEEEEEEGEGEGEGGEEGTDDLEQE